MKKIFLSLAVSIQMYSYSQCLTDHIQKEAEKNNPSIITDKLNFYQNLQPLTSQKRATKYIIPVVFHVIHTFGAENISEAQIIDQIRILNENYSLKNANKANIRLPFKTLAADCEIEFRLAKIDPQGNCTNGINRIYSPKHVLARDNVKSIANAKWPYTKYLNIWTVSSIDDQQGNLSSTIVAGFATFPFWTNQGGGGLDGIVLRADYCGTIGTGRPSSAGSVLTHEIGHYLGLLHTFTDGCDPNNDNCSDTPPVASTFTNATCPVNGNSCNTDAPDLIDQWENYMDYSSGDCQAMFTPIQKNIMFNTLTNYSFRKNMVSNANLIATGVVDGGTAPKAFFSSSSRTVCVGELVSFYDISCAGTVTSRQWQFPGSNTTSTNKDTPRIMYYTPGKYKVTLLATNSAGSNTLAVDNYIEVLPNVSPNKPTIVQGFEDANWQLSTGWVILDPSSVKFTVDNTIGYYSSKSLNAPISSSVPAGQKFQLVLPSVDLRKLKGAGAKLSMMVGYTRQNSASQEKLKVYMSRGCNNANWTSILSRTATQISYSTTAFASTFKPADNSQWKLITTSLAPYENDSNINFMIEVESGNGNAVYIDNINISQFNTNMSLT